MRRKSITKTLSQGPIFPKTTIEDGVKNEKGNKLKRGMVVRNPPRYSESLKTTVPGRRGRIVDMYACNGQDLIDVVLDGKDGAAGKATWRLATIKKSQAKIRSEVESMPNREKK